MKKLLSLSLVCAMMLSMSVSAFAAPTAKVDVNAEMLRARNGISDIPVEETGIVTEAYMTMENGDVVPLQTYTTVRVVDNATPFSLNAEPIYAVTSYAAATEETFEGILDPYNGEVWAYGTIYYQKPFLGDYTFVSTDGGWAPGGWTLSGRTVLYGFGATGTKVSINSNTFDISVNREGRTGRPQIETKAIIKNAGTITLRMNDAGLMP